MCAQQMSNHYPAAGPTILFNKKTMGSIVLLNETTRIPNSPYE